MSGLSSRTDLRSTPDRARKRTTRRLQIKDADYRRLADFRYSIRTFLDFSEQAARNAGLTPQQHQALLAIRGLQMQGDTSLGDLAHRLRIRHHSAVELAHRLSASKLIRRCIDAADRRRVLVSLTPKAQRILESLSAVHLEELRRMRAALLEVLALTEQ